MKRLLAIMFLITIAAPALAQAPQRKFIPFTVDEKAAQEIQNWLNEQPFKFSAPVLQWLATQEQLAQSAADKAAAKEAPAK